MKKFALSLVIIFLSGSAFSQTKPDTLIIETPKKQKIILIADDVNSFRNLNSDSLINAALRKVRDSLNASRPPWTYLNTLSKEDRNKYLVRMGDSLRRINDSLQVVDGLTTKERHKKNQEAKYSDKSLYTRNLKSNIPFGLEFNAGAGTIRNRFSSVIEGGIVFQPEKQDYYSLGPYPDYAFIALTANRYYTFEQATGSNFKTFNNTFINLSLGSRQETKRKTNAFASELELGIGYLIEREGSYFGKNTFKLFGSVVTKYKFVRLTPEIYITDSFKEAFPGFSIKFF